MAIFNMFLVSIVSLGGPEIKYYAQPFNRQIFQRTCIIAPKMPVTYKLSTTQP